MAEMPLRRWSDLENMQQDMERLLDYVLRGKRPPAFLSPQAWQPAIDVCESQESVEILVELAGVRREDIELRITQDALTIHGTRVARHHGHPVVCYQLEIPYGTFERVVQLPSGLDIAQITAASRDGLLEITIPRQRPATFRVPIQTV
jgi:HSP20 family protein